MDSNKIAVFGVRYGPAPYYGEIPYSGRMIEKGFNAGYDSQPHEPFPSF